MPTFEKLNVQAPPKTMWAPGRLYSNFQDAPWDNKRWPNFIAAEFACKCNKYCSGEYYHDEQFLDRLQFARKKFNMPIKINSGHRCSLHNAAVGGAPLSMHKSIAVDISTRGFNDYYRSKLLRACQEAGFKGFGFYSNWLHVDLGRARIWFIGKGRQIWQSLI